MGANVKFPAADRPETSEKRRDTMRGDGGVRVVFSIPLSARKSDGADMRRPSCSNMPQAVAIGYYVLLARPGIGVSEERDDITNRCQRLEQSKG